MAPLDNTYGAVFIGVVFAAVLYGFSCLQTWFYYIHYTKDPWYYKLLVFCVFMSDTIHQMLITHALYKYVITYFGDVDELAMIVWSIIAEVIFNGITTLLVQCFLTMRVWKLSNKNWFMTGSALILVLLEFLMSLVFAGRALHFTTWVELSSLKALSLAVNAAAAAGDVLIAGYLCFLLQASRTGFQRSETIIKKLIMFTINTGLLTSVCALASLVSYSVWPHTFIYITFYFCIGRLYCNSLLATLNARKGLQIKMDSSDAVFPLQGSTDKMPSRIGVGSTSKRMPNNISITIDTTLECQSTQDERESCMVGVGDVKGDMVV